MDTAQLFWATLAATTACGIGVALTAMLFWLLQNAERVANDFAAAARRYAVRNEVVKEYYDPASMDRVRIYEAPTPYRVTVAKKFKKGN